MALITCPECKKEISDTAKSCPSCGYELKASEKQLCPKCNIEAIAVKKKNQVSIGGILGALIFIIAIPILFYNWLIGIAAMILGAIIGSVARGEYIEMTCPKCKKVISKIQ
ncbi:MAG: zinc ribbon domain-containing protein [Candidatus Aminicenantes bacterium]|nr:zinc ribbon domain-containing protein [Candidatus Aminicenantes bacterium]